jgi:hypothetical protein
LLTQANRLGEPVLTEPFAAGVVPLSGFGEGFVEIVRFLEAKDFFGIENCLLENLDHSIPL